MESAATRTPHRVLRVLLASGFLALGWVAVDLIAHSEPAAAAQSIDLLPLVDDTATTVTDTVESLVAPIVPPLATPVETVVSAVVSDLVSPVMTEVVAPITEPIVSVTTPLVPPVTEVVSVIDVVAPVAAAVASGVENEQVLVGTALVVGSLLAASVIPLIPVPGNGVPSAVPLAPAAPPGPNSSNFVAIYGELNSGILAGIGALRAGNALGDALPPSPTFAFDTTPD